MHSVEKKNFALTWKKKDRENNLHYNFVLSK